MSAPTRELPKHRRAFESWHQAERNWRAVVKEFGVSEETVYDWTKAFSWHQRADTRDREAAKLAERAAIQRQAKMITRQRQAAELLQLRGTEFFREHKIENAQDAIRAIKEGEAMERRAEGLPEYLLRVMVMSEDELRLDIERLRRLTDGMVSETTPALGDGGEAAAGDDDPDADSGAGPADAVWRSGEPETSTLPGPDV